MILLLRHLWLVRRLIGIHNKQRDDKQINGEKQSILQRHLDVVARNAVDGPGTRHDESGDDDREGQWPNALGANDFRLNIKEYMNSHTHMERVIGNVPTYQTQDWHCRQTEDQTEQDQTQSTGQNRFVFVLGVRNNGRRNGSANADTAPDGVLLLVRCVPIENRNEQNAQSEAH